MRAQRSRLGVAAGLLLGLGTVAGVVALLGPGAGGADAGPTVAVDGDLLPVVEGADATRVVEVPVTLTPAAATDVLVDFATVDETAIGGEDYVAATGRLTFPAGTTAQSIPLTVRGDSTLEDHELFQVRLTNVVGAALGDATRRVQVQNDETPQLLASAGRAKEGRVVAVTARLRQRYIEKLVVQVVTRDGTARAPGDYAPKRTAIAFAADTRGPKQVSIATKADARVEPSESIALIAEGSGMLAGASAPVDDGPVVTTTAPAPVCRAGSVPTAAPPAAPPSPSTPATLLPPAEVIGTDQWDLVFNDEFGDPAYTAAKWATGMRTGDRTLEGNTELQWYVPENSVLTTDDDGFGPIGVLRQDLRRQVVPGRHYTVRTLSRLYPPEQCPAHYHAGANTSTAASNRNPTRTPFQFTSGMLNNSKSFGFKYGYIETRVKMPKGFALWPALWLRDWGGWNYEIDVFEVFDRQSRVLRSGYWWGNGENRGTQHDGGDIGVNADGTRCRHKVPVPATSEDPGTCTLADTVDLSAGYHTIGMLWTQDGYDFFLDGVRRWRSPAGADVADTYHHLIVNLALGNNEYEFDWTKQGARPFHPNLFSSSLMPKRTIEWDYVRVWQAHDSLDVCTPPHCR